MKKVADIEESVFVDFLDSIHGKSRLDLFVRDKSVVNIMRSSVLRDYEMRRVYNNYSFEDNGQTGYVVAWRDEDGEVHDISSKFTKFMNPSVNASLDEPSEAELEM